MGVTSIWRFGGLFVYYCYLIIFGCRPTLDIGSIIGCAMTLGQSHVDQRWHLSRLQLFLGVYICCKIEFCTCVCPCLLHVQLYRIPHSFINEAVINRNVKPLARSHGMMLTLLKHLQLFYSSKTCQLYASFISFTQLCHSSSRGLEWQHYLRSCQPWLGMLLGPVPELLMVMCDHLYANLRNKYFVMEYLLLLSLLLIFLGKSTFYSLQDWSL